MKFFLLALAAALLLLAGCADQEAAWQESQSTLRENCQAAGGRWIDGVFRIDVRERKDGVCLP